MCRLEILTAATMLALSLGSAAGLAQGPAVTPDAMTGKVLDIQGQVLDIVGFGADSQGPSSRITGQVVSLGAAIQDLKRAGSGVVVTETPKPPAPEPKAAPRKEVKIYVPADVLFDFDKADLRPEAATVLERVASVLRSDPTSTATIEGHTDGKGNDQYNQTLSERRAQSVRQWLVARAVSNSMAAYGFGKTRPVAPNTLPNGADDPEGRQKNRRVEITFTTAQ
jgi:outer membrane protein OmpA-like peptidoglycan-associated protein